MLRIANRLPRESHYVGAIYDDDELAPHLFELEENKKEGFGLTGWSQELEVLHNIAKGVESLLSRTIANTSKNGKGPTVSPSPRPTTALDRYKKKKDYLDHLDRVKMLLPHQP